MSELQRLIDAFDATEAGKALRRAMDAFAVAQSAFAPAAAEIERYNRMQAEQQTRRMLGVPDWFKGASSDWTWLQGALAYPPQAFRAARRLACLPSGARARHRKEMKRKRRKSR